VEIAKEETGQEPHKSDSRGKLKQVFIAAMLAAAVGALAVRLKAGPQRIGPNWPLLASMLGWVLFSIYWSASATHAPAKTAESRGSRRIHEVLINAGYLLLLLPSVLSRPIPVVQARFLPVSPVWVALGLAMEAGSLALAVWARRTLGQNWSGRIEIKMDHRLIRSGPYRRLRHPIYTAVVGMAAGTAITIGKAYTLFAVAVIVGAYIRKIRLEETALDGAFGPEYDEYRQSTWGLIPGLF
jgi:protein-S-isoprenylcysteine O-methyltransferase Ste14